MGTRPQGPIQELNLPHLADFLKPVGPTCQRKWISKYGLDFVLLEAAMAIGAFKDSPSYRKPYSKGQFLSQWLNNKYKTRIK